MEARVRACSLRFEGFGQGTHRKGETWAPTYLEEPLNLGFEIITDKLFSGLCY